MNNSSICNNILNSIQSVFVCDNNITLKKILCTFLAGGHILLEDNPGLGKTFLVKTFAKTCDISWKRIQFTPDLMPSDIIGTKIWNSQTSSFQLEKGPLFTNFLLADEINRAMPKTQSALLEAMEEKQITIDGTTYKLEKPFIVMATQNPIEMEGTYSLPEAQMDRFLIKLSLGYLDKFENECNILKKRISWGKDDPTNSISPIVSISDITSSQKEIEKIFVHDNILNYITRIVRKTREHPSVRLGSSPRGALALLKLSRAMAFINNRSFVIPDDIKSIAVDALSHRILLNFECSIEGIDPRSIILEVLNSIEVPTDFFEKE